MANCKLCGRKIEDGRPWHKPCWEQAAREMAETFCDEYCRFPRQCENQEELDRHCDRCALIRLLNLGI